MMKLIASLVALSIATPAIAAPTHRAATAKAPTQTVPLPPTFEFMGQTTDKPRTMMALQGQDCTTEGAKVTCANYNFPTIADRPMRHLVLEFFNDKLYSVSATFGELAYRPVADAFTAKYGQPATTEVRKWQSKAGGVFDNTVLIWKFSDSGTLELESMGGQVGEGRYTFTSTTNAPPAEKPKIDF